MNLPIGSIIAWHKSFANTPALPPDFVEMNGQVLDNPDSPYDGQTIPNWNGEGRFLRGANTSGVLQDDAMQGHRHDVNAGTSASAGENKFIRANGAGDDVQRYANEPMQDGTNGTPRIAAETRPKNASVVWIMKVAEGEDPAFIDADTLEGKHAAEFGPVLTFGSVAGTVAEGNHNHGGTFEGDADTLDGKHAAEFMPAESADTWHRVGAAGEPAYGNRWHAAGPSSYENIQFKKKNGIGFIQGGVIREHNLETENGLFTLPEEYRPAVDTYAGYGHYTCGLDSGCGLFLVRSNGQVWYFGNGPSDDAQYCINIAYPIG